MLKPLSQRNAQSVIEYLTLITFLLGVFLIFGKYIWQGFAGRWRNTGEGVGMGLQYEPGVTIQCRFDTFAQTGVWYNLACYDRFCDCHSVSATTVTCHDCILGCQISKCVPVVGEDA